MIGVPHSVAFTACTENIHCIDTVLDLCRETGVSHFSISKLQPDSIASLTPISFIEWKRMKERARMDALEV